MVSRFPESVLTPKGGVESATVNLVDGLLERGDVDLTLITLEHGLSTPQIDNVDGVCVHRLPRSSMPMFIDVVAGPSTRRLNSYINDLAPDIVHYQESWGLGGYQLSSPHVMTVHGFDSLNLPTEARPGWQVRAKIWQTVENYCLARHQHLISIAPYVTEQIGATQAEIIDISNAISRSIFDITPAPVANRIFYAGWLDRRKNLTGLLKVIARLRDEHGIRAELRAAGTASDAAYKQEIDEFIDEHDLAEQVTLLGQVNQQQIREELSQTNLLALLSYQENAPMIISEAMALGVPVVCSDLCGMVNMVAHDERGYRVDPDDIAGAAAHMADVLTDAGLRERLGHAAKAYATAEYHPDSVAAKTVACYRQVIDETAHAATIAEAKS
ncbi:MAG: glycosyltransferase family 4 protein [Pseudomonadaceae bacterium]|nr:glycosyltransferase family 4 protein [Pseudomonadaceae bacterium]